LEQSTVASSTNASSLIRSAFVTVGDHRRPLGAGWLG
jgi:hypothetical protein